MAQSGGLFALPFSAPALWCPATALRSPEIVPTGGTGITVGCDRPACPWTTETGCPRNRPVLYLNSWAWVRGQQRAGTWPPPNRTGRAYTIMARPRPEYGETGDGSVPVLTPQGHEVALMQQLVRSRAVTGLDQDDLIGIAPCDDGDEGWVVMQQLGLSNPEPVGDEHGQIVYFNILDAAEVLKTGKVWRSDMGEAGSVDEEV